ncbi:MAG: hypothetical protein SVY53_13210 [Chloroflexota bacterium]|nr:hypothetical protein [Chloroflexota bacterium]
MAFKKTVSSNPSVGRLKPSLQSKWERGLSSTQDKWVVSDYSMEVPQVVNSVIGKLKA